MGIHAEVELANAHERLPPVTLTARVVPAATHLCIPQNVAGELRLETLNQRMVMVNGGQARAVDYVGPVAVRFADRRCLVGALVLGEQALLGSIPIDSMDLVIDSARGMLTVNPANPDVAGSIAMGNLMVHA